jgi:hypothetical protein
VAGGRVLPRPAERDERDPVLLEPGGLRVAEIGVGDHERVDRGRADQLVVPDHRVVLVGREQQHVVPRDPALLDQ